MPVQTKSSTSAMTSLFERFTGWLLLAPGEIGRLAARMDRRSLGLAALIFGAVLLLSANLIASILFRNMKVDLTSERLFTISEGTKKVLAKIDEPISVRVYYTKKLGEVAPLFGKYFERVKALLEQYRDISRGRLQVTFLDPEPFSDAEDRAVAAGLRGVRLNQDGETGYFGLVASNTTDNDAIIEFFAPDRERFLEYDLTKLINGLANPKKKVVGLIAGININGGMNPMQPMRQPSPPWMVMEQIREFFEVRNLEQTTKIIPSDIDVLLIVQPMLLTREAAYAVDQYALSGGRVLAFFDPNAEMSPMGGGPGMQLPMSEEALKLLKAWGVEYDADKVVGDPNMARRVQYGGRGGRPATVTEYLAWLAIDKTQINEKDPLAAGIEKLNLASAGALRKRADATTIVQPIIETTKAAGLIEADKVRFQPDPLAIKRTFASGGEPLMLAARILGEAKSAFPEGRPKPEEKPKDAEKTDGKPDAAKTLDEKVQDRMAEAKAKVEDEQARAAAAKPHVASGRVNIVVVSDSDMLADQFWVEVRDFLGQQVALPQTHNAAFVVNALENLSGGEALSGLRGRGISERPFETVLQLRREAESRFRAKEEALVARLKEVQEKLAKVETRGGEGGGPTTVLLTDKDKQTIEQFRNEMVTIRRELRDVKADLRRDIDRLSWWLHFFNIAAVPLVIAIGGLAYATRRRFTD
jgi:ABC-type uncharacterized transport system involved in gliding motility auxiliary subunit